MSERKYSVTEIDALRRAVENKWLFGSYGQTGSAPHAGFSRSYREDEKMIAVEQMVRTHMLAGHTAEDLYASESS
jgi:hypothetical protein